MYENSMLAGLVYFQNKTAQNGGNYNFLARDITIIVKRLYRYVIEQKTVSGVRLTFLSCCLGSLDFGAPMFIGSCCIKRMRKPLFCTFSEIQ